MENKHTNTNTKKWSSRNLTVRVTNRTCGRVDIHKNISAEEVEWIALNPNLEVDFLDQRHHREHDE